MTKTERLLFIINLLKVKKTITFDKLLEKCRVSKRTLYRDIAFLSELNFPISYDKNKGYRLTKKINLPRMNFNKGK